MIVKLTLKESLRKLLEKGQFEVMAKEKEDSELIKGVLVGIDIEKNIFVVKINDGRMFSSFCFIEKDDVYVPYDSLEEFEMKSIYVCRKDFGPLYKSIIKEITIYKDEPCFAIGHGNLGYNFKEMFDKYTWEDGSPIGKLKDIEEDHDNIVFYCPECNAHLTSDQDEADAFCELKGVK